jgi:hypothetical protein
VYIVDLETEKVEQVIDYDAPSISWEGRGGPRGLRGIAFYGDEVYLAASDEIFVYSSDFCFKRSIRNKYLEHCHETYVTGDTLYITSTGRDSVIEYDLQTRSLMKGYYLKFRGLTRYINMRGYRGERSLGAPIPRLRVFDPDGDEGPAHSNTCHLNSVFYANGILFASGTRCAHLLAITDSKLSSYARIPYGTHNTRPFGEGLIMNDTRNDCVSYLDRRGGTLSLPINRYDQRELLHSHVPQDHARQAFGRGLCLLGEGLIVGGSSPATVSVYDLSTSRVLKTINLTMDVRNTIHGLEAWPF